MSPDMMHQRDTIHFLLIEDDQDDVLIIKTALCCRGVECTLDVVRDGREATDYLIGRNGLGDRRKYPLPNLILLDLMMPRMDGFDFMEWLRNDSPGDLHVLPVIVISASTEQDDIDRCYALGANSYLAKATDPEKFASTIRMLKEYWLMHARTPAPSKE